MSTFDVVIDGATVHVVRVGAGDEPVLMLHGGGPGSDGMTNYRTCLPFFETSNPVIIPDLPGFGKSEQAVSDGSYLESTGDRIVRLLDQLGINRTHVVGNSLGGGVGLSMARDHPERIGRLVLMNPAGASIALLRSEAPEMGMIRDYYSPPGPSLERMMLFAREMVNRVERLPKGLVEERYRLSLLPGARAGMEAAMRTFDPHTEQAEAMAARRGSLWSQLQTIASPVLLLWGREDRAASLDRAWFLEARLPNAHLYVFPDCGHWIQIEWPEQFATVVKTFLLMGSRELEEHWVPS